MSLGRPSSDPTGKKDKKPYQKGKAKGKKGDKNVEVEKEWQVDLGADISAISSENAKNFDTKATAGTAGSVGGGAIPIVSGVTMVFKRFNKDNKEEEIECSMEVAVLPYPRDILGMDQLDKFSCTVLWNSRTGKGKLFEEVSESEKGPVKKIVPGTPEGPLKSVKPEFERSLTAHVESGLFTESEKDDMLLQKMTYEANRDMIESKYYGKIVGIAGGELIVGESVHEVIERVKNTMPRKMVYLERVGETLFGGAELKISQ